MTSLSASGRALHRPELDTLRAAGAAAVLLAHFCPQLIRGVDIGREGVCLFFVLSGYLITRILLDGRERIEQGQTTLGAELRTFYLRRSFRIFPLYYGVVLLTCLFNIEDVRSQAAWLLTYTYNFKVWWTGDWNRLTAHFWTLAVEEQFYLLWPLLILTIAHRVRPWIIAAFIPAALIFRLAVNAGWCGPKLGQIVLLPAYWDMLAAGGWIAWWQRQSGTTVGQRRSLQSLLWFVGIGSIVWVALHRLGQPFASWPSPWENTGSLCLYAVIVDLCSRGIKGPVRWLLTLPVFCYLGRISYGIYVYHNFMHYFGPGLSRRLFGIRYFPRLWEHAAWLTLCTLVAASLSYHFFERPMLGLRDRLAPMARKIRASAL